MIKIRFGQGLNDKQLSGIKFYEGHREGVNIYNEKGYCDFIRYIST